MSIARKSRSVLRFAMAAGLGTVLCSSAAASDDNTDCNSNGIPDECEIVVDGTSAGLITFEAADGYTIGDGITEINAITSLQCIEVSAVANELGLVPPLLNVAADPNGGANQVLDARTHPNGADILFNFSTPISFFRAEFVDNLSGAFNVSLTAFDHTGTALDIVGTSSLGLVSGAEPTFRLDEHPEKMGRRRETAEHPFGTIKS